MCESLNEGCCKTIIEIINSVLFAEGYEVQLSYSHYQFKEILHHIFINETTFTNKKGKKRTINCVQFKTLQIFEEFKSNCEYIHQIAYNDLKELIEGDSFLIYILF